MTPQDTIAVVAYFGAAWPTFDPSDDTIDAWVAELGDIVAADANDAMRQLVRTSEFAPSIAKFRAECKAVALSRTHRHHVALPPVRYQVPQELLGTLRRLVNEMGGRTHNHKGPNPCKVCGGLAAPSKKTGGKSRADAIRAHEHAVAHPAEIDTRRYEHAEDKP